MNSVANLEQGERLEDARRAKHLLENCSPFVLSLSTARLGSAGIAFQLQLSTNSGGWRHHGEAKTVCLSQNTWRELKNT